MPDISLEQVGESIVDKASEIYKYYFDEEVTDETKKTKEFLAITKGVMSGMIMDETYEPTFKVDHTKVIKLEPKMLCEACFKEHEGSCSTSFRLLKFFRHLIRME